MLASLTITPHRSLVVGFAAETQGLVENAQRKLNEKNCDLIVANDVSRADIGMDSADNEVIIFFERRRAEKTSRRAKKTELARDLIKIILNMRAKNV